MSHEQIVHDRINLYRLVRRLEKSIAEEGWNNTGDLKDSEPFPHAAWIRTQGALGVSEPIPRTVYFPLWESLSTVPSDTNRFPVHRR